MLTPILLIKFQLSEEVLKDGSYEVDRAYFRVMRIQTIADEVATHFLTWRSARYESSSIVFDWASKGDPRGHDRCRHSPDRLPSRATCR
jgi:hypothetical protein